MFQNFFQDFQKFSAILLGIEKNRFLYLKKIPSVQDIFRIASCSHATVLNNISTHYLLKTTTTTESMSICWFKVKYYLGWMSLPFYSLFLLETSVCLAIMVGYVLTLVSLVMIWQIMCLNKLTRPVLLNLIHNLLLQFRWSHQWVLNICTKNRLKNIRFSTCLKKKN